MGSQRTREDGDSTFKAASVTGPALYYLGIVDFLQDWTFNKKVERALKIYVARKDADGLSVNHPEVMTLILISQNQFFSHVVVLSALHAALSGEDGSNF